MAQTDAVLQRSAVTLAQIKIELEIEGAEHDTRLTRLLNAAKTAADLYMNNPFQDADGNDLAIPALVEEGVFAAVEMRLARAPFGVTEEKVDSLQRKFAVYATVSDAMKEVKGTFWRPFRQVIGGRL